MDLGPQALWGRVRRLELWATVRQPGAWLHLCTGYSTYLLLWATLATLVGKIAAVHELGMLKAAPFFPVPLTALDLALYMGVAGALAACEARWRRSRFVTVPVAVALYVLAVSSAGYLIASGEQANRTALDTLFSRWDDVRSIVEESAQTIDARWIVSTVVSLLVLIAVPPLARLVLRRGGRWNAQESAVRRTHLGVALALLGTAVWLVNPRPRSLQARELTRNALWATARGYLNNLHRGNFKGFKPQRIVAQSSIEEFGRRNTPNVVFVVLESTRFDHTSLSREKLADTPNLARLANRGVNVETTRAVLPHTTKSLVSVLCGRMPLMQKSLAELSADIKLQCLPRILLDAGYYTGFFQSAYGVFEDRPRLVEKLGFEYFKGWEDIRGRRLGYLASADASLVKPTMAWLDEIEASRNPFMLTVLTSATHHPYRLPPDVRKRAKADKKPYANRKQKYARLVEEEDRVLGALVDGLRERGLYDNTIIVVLGDHGEGFGDHGVKQHDNNFFEEGLRVPWVIAGPGVPNVKVEGNASLMDVTPTLLGLLGVPRTRAAVENTQSYDVLSPEFAEARTAPRWFGCWFASRCRGFVTGEHKIVFRPSDDELMFFDLAADPEESEPLAALAEHEDGVRGLHGLFDSLKALKWKIKYGAVNRYGEWRCKKDKKGCKHPRARKKKYRYAPKGKGKKGGKGKRKRAKGKRGAPKKSAPGEAKKPAPKGGAPAVQPPAKEGPAKPKGQPKGEPRPKPKGEPDASPKPATGPAPSPDAVPGDPPVRDR